MKGLNTLGTSDVTGLSTSVIHGIRFAPLLGFMPRHAFFFLLEEPSPPHSLGCQILEHPLFYWMSSLPSSSSYLGQSWRCFVIWTFLLKLNSSLTVLRKAVCMHCREMYMSPVWVILERVKRNKPFLLIRMG